MQAISPILKNENYELCFLAGSFVDQITTRKKGTVIWPPVGMFGGSISSDCFGGFLAQITSGKKYSRLAIGCNVGLFWRVCCYVFWRVPQSNCKLQPEKKVQSSGSLTPFATRLTLSESVLESFAHSFTDYACLTLRKSEKARKASGQDGI